MCVQAPALCLICGHAGPSRIYRMESSSILEVGRGGGEKQTQTSNRGWHWDPRLLCRPNSVSCLLPRQAASPSSGFILLEGFCQFVGAPSTKDSGSNPDTPPPAGHPRRLTFISEHRAGLAITTTVLAPTGGSPSAPLEDSPEGGVTGRARSYCEGP